MQNLGVYAKGKKRGGDGGICGVKFFTDSNGATQKIIVSVKGGGDLVVSDTVLAVELKPAIIFV